MLLITGTVFKVAVPKNIKHYLVKELWHSCETQLATVINDWAKILDNKGQVDTFILHFEKAFDTPPHELLKIWN